MFLNIFENGFIVFWKSALHIHLQYLKNIVYFDHALLYKYLWAVSVSCPEEPCAKTHPWQTLQYVTGHQSLTSTSF